MVQLAIRKCRTANAAVKVIFVSKIIGTFLTLNQTYRQISVCGEHAGDPASIRFFNKIGVDCVSCAPHRVPVAKVAAAQAHIEETGSE
jgi:phosphoenolpyruvate synthase/pyruvate phosphate dikinase